MYEYCQHRFGLLDFSDLTLEQLHSFLSHLGGLDDESWLKRFSELEEFKKKEGHCNVSQSDLEHKKLGIWVKTQRSNKDTMSSSRREKLDGIKFTWSVQVPWEDRLSELVEFEKKNGHCNVSQTDPDHKELGIWVMNQRNRVSTMSAERKAKVNRIGFTWSV